MSCAICADSVPNYAPRYQIGNGRALAMCLRHATSLDAVVGRWAARETRRCEEEREAEALLAREETGPW